MKNKAKTPDLVTEQEKKSAKKEKRQEKKKIKAAKKAAKERKYIQNKVIIRICVVGVLILTIAGIIPFNVFKQRIESYTEDACSERLGDFAVSDAYSTKQELDRVMNIISIAEEEFIDFEDLNSDEAVSTLRRVWAETGFSQMKITNTDGRSINQQGVITDISHATYFKRSMYGECCIVKGDTEIPQEPGMLIFSVPIIAEGKVIGTLDGSYDVFSLSKMMEVQSFEGESYSLLIDAKGNVVLNSSNRANLNKEEDYYTFLEKVKMKKGSMEEIEKNISLRETGTFTYQYKGQTRVGFYTPVDTNNWYLIKLVTGEQVTAMYQPVNKMVGALALSLVVLCILSCLFIIWAITLINAHKKKQLQEALIQAQEANGAKTQFLSRMSHEIRTPMNAIVNLTALAKEHLQEPEKTEEYLEKIGYSSKVLLNIINDILDMNAIENQKIKIAQEQFDMKALLSGISTIYYPQCQNKKITFEMNTSEMKDDYFIGDALRINQVLLNLVSNAYKFTGEGGKIRVNASQSARKDDTVWVHFAVSDTGTGMTEEMQQRLFKPFEQESATTAQKHGGSGLGLSIAKSLIDLMRGSISVQSEKDKGTTFTVEIPLLIAVKEEAAVAGCELKDIHALIVDDDPGTTEYTSVILDRIGVQYDVANSGEQAVQLLMAKQQKNEKYDICFVDWKMPGMNGVEVIKKIREIYNNEPTVIVVSAYDLTEISEEAKQAGANMFLSKPLFQSAVFNALMSISGGKIAKNVEKKTDYDFTGKRVLLAEDNELNTEIATEILEMVNMQVEHAANGQIAVDMFTNAPVGYYDVILMDIQMPVMDGYDAAKAIRHSTHPEAATIQIFAMTANAFHEDVSKALDMGMNGHIAKPIDTAVLYQVLDDAIFGEK